MMLSTKLQAAQARIRTQWYPHFTWQLHDSAPWSPLSRPLRGATVALLSTCGLYRYDQQLPFAAWNPLGDPAFREIHIDTPVDRLHIAHTHYEREHAETDINVVLPILHFQQLAAQGIIGRLYPWTYSFMGYLPEPAALIADTAPQVARRLAADGVHAAFLTPC
jgi:D-proline reductase (dithiol) PrdB